MKFAKASIFVVLLSVAFITSACQVTVNQRDEKTISNLADAKADFTKSIARASGIESPAEDIVLTKDQFPIGKLTWDEYDSVLGEYDAKVFYEEAKKKEEDANIN